MSCLCKNVVSYPVSDLIENSQVLYEIQPYSYQYVRYPRLLKRRGNIAVEASFTIVPFSGELGFNFSIFVVSLVVKLL
jgi:hypothetical protein